MPKSSATPKKEANVSDAEAALTDSVVASSVDFAEMLASSAPVPVRRPPASPSLLHRNFSLKRAFSLRRSSDSGTSPKSSSLGTSGKSAPKGGTSPIAVRSSSSSSLHSPPTPLTNPLTDKQDFDRAADRQRDRDNEAPSSSSPRATVGMARRATSDPELVASATPSSSSDGVGGGSPSTASSPRSTQLEASRLVDADTPSPVRTNAGGGSAAGQLLSSSATNVPTSSAPASSPRLSSSVPSPVLQSVASKARLGLLRSSSSKRMAPSTPRDPGDSRTTIPRPPLPGSASDRMSSSEAPRPAVDPSVLAELEAELAELAMAAPARAVAAETLARTSLSVPTKPVPVSDLLAFLSPSLRRTAQGGNVSFQTDEDLAEVVISGVAVQPRDEAEQAALRRIAELQAKQAAASPGSEHATGEVNPPDDLDGVPIDGGVDGFAAGDVDGEPIAEPVAEPTAAPPPDPPAAAEPVELIEIGEVPLMPTRAEAGIPELVRKRNQVVNEVFMTERDYVKDLETVSREYIEVARERGVLTEDEISGVFVNMELLAYVHRRFVEALDEALRSTLADMNERLAAGGTMATAASAQLSLGESFKSLQQSGFLRHYKEYASRYEEAGVFLRKLQKQRKDVRKFFTDPSRRAKVKGLDADSLLIKPVQRLCKYPLLMRELIKFMSKMQEEGGDVATDALADDLDEIASVKEKLEQIVSKVNQHKALVETRNARLDHLKALDRSGSKKGSLKVGGDVLARVRSGSVARPGPKHGVEVVEGDAPPSPEIGRKSKLASLTGEQLTVEAMAKVDKKARKAADKLERELAQQQHDVFDAELVYFGTNVDFYLRRDKSEAQDTLVLFSSAPVPSWTCSDLSAAPSVDDLEDATLPPYPGATAEEMVEMQAIAAAEVAAQERSRADVVRQSMQIDASQTHLIREWYLDSYERSDAEDALVGAANGAFVVRPSMVDNMLTISYRTASGQVAHTVVNKLPDGGGFSVEDESQTYASVELLVRSLPYLSEEAALTQARTFWNE